MHIHFTINQNLKSQKIIKKQNNLTNLLKNNIKNFIHKQQNQKFLLNAITKSLNLKHEKFYKRQQQNNKLLKYYHKKQQNNIKNNKNSKLADNLNKKLNSNPSKQINFKKSSEKNTNSINNYQKHYINKKQNSKKVLNKMSLKNLKQFKIQNINNLNTHKNQQYKNKKSRIDRKSTETYIKAKLNQKSKSKEKYIKKDFEKNNQYKQKRHKKLLKTSSCVKSSYISRKISQNNSLQKNINKTILQKNNSMKNLKSQNKIQIKDLQYKKFDSIFYVKKIKNNIKKQKHSSYNSTKISKRNSLKNLFCQNDNKQFIIHEQPESLKSSKTNNKEITLNASNQINKKFIQISNLRLIQEKYSNLINDQIKEKTQNINNKNIQRKSCEYPQIFKTFRKKYHQKYDEQKNSNFNIEQKNSTSFDNLFQKIEGQNDVFIQNSFYLQCQQVLRERFQKLQQKTIQTMQDIDHLKNIQTLNSYQNLIKNNKQYSLSSGIKLKLQQNLVDFTQISMTIKYQIRCQILDWLSKLSQTILLKTQTYHLAANYFDIYIHKNQKNIEQINMKNFKLISLGCLILAIKMDQRAYQYQIIDVISTLEKEFTKNQLIQIQNHIFQSFQQKNKIQTLVFWFDFYIQKWDVFISQSSYQNKRQYKDLYLRSVQGKAYQNYRKLIDMANLILLKGTIFNYPIIQITFASLYILFIKNNQKIQNQKKLQQISAFKLNQKQNLNEKSNNKSSQTINTFKYLKNSQEQIQKKYKNLNNIIKENNQLKIYSTLNLNQSQKYKNNFILSNRKKNQQQFRQFFERFLITNSKIQSFQSIIRIIQDIKEFSQIKEFLQIDLKIYENSQSYEQFLRYHVYSPYLKQFALKKNNQLRNHMNLLKKIL